jgi:hypothetical protein
MQKMSFHQELLKYELLMVNLGTIRSGISQLPEPPVPPQNYGHFPTALDQIHQKLDESVKGKP